VKEWGFVWREAIRRLISKPFTIHYPFVKVEAVEGYRGRIEFHLSKCKGCGMCAMVCPSKAITMVKEEKVKPSGRMPVFELARCCYCGLCAEYCPAKAIKLTKDYHLVGFRKEDIKARVIP